MAGLTQNYHETVDPLASVNETAVTLATTYKALVPAGRYNIGSQYFNKLGRKIRIRMAGQITTGITPGNGQMGILFGTGADANGVNLVQSVAFALIASQTNISWEAYVFIHCRSTGPTGTLFATGRIIVGQAVSTVAQPLLFPPSAPVVSAACDLTGALIPNVQFLRSGSTAETMQVVDYDISPMS